MSCPTLHDLPSPPAGKTGWPWSEASPGLPALMPHGTPWPRVTVVTPSFNQAPFIEETIRSVLLQSYPNLEYILIDGDSTDGSLEIIKRYAPWLSYWESAKDRGQSHAINKGWARSSGDILAWLNSDDVYTPGAIQIAVEALQAHPAAAMVYSDMPIIDEHSHELRLWVPGTFNINALLDGSTYIPQQTVFIKRQPLLAVGWLDETLHMAMDLDLWLRLGLDQAQAMLYLPGKRLAKFRKHPHAKTSTYHQDFSRDSLAILDKVYARAGLPIAVTAKKNLAYGKVYFEHAAIAAASLNTLATIRYFLKALFTCPSYVARRPLGSLYLLKQAVLGLFTRKPSGP